MVIEMVTEMVTEMVITTHIAISMVLSVYPQAFVGVGWASPSPQTTPQRDSLLVVAVPDVPWTCLESPAIALPMPCLCLALPCKVKAVHRANKTVLLASTFKAGFSKYGFNCFVRFPTI